MLTRHVILMRAAYRCLCHSSACSQALSTSSAPTRGDTEKVKTHTKSGPPLQYFIANSLSEKQNDPVDTEAPHPYVRDSDVRARNSNVYFETYGCQMNVNDTEVAWSVLKSAGFTKTEDVNAADVVLIMTCAIREGAESKIWSRINQLKALKKARRKSSRGPMQIGILGCMAERLKEKLVEREKEVDIVAGPDSYRDLPRLLRVATSGQVGVNVLLSLDETYADVVPVRLTENAKSAYVSIMRGCNNMCTYCIVPFTRGRERSRPVVSILDEVRALSDQGVKEVILLGQNVNSYRDTSTESQALIARPTAGDGLMSRGFRTVYKTQLGGMRFADLLDKVSQIDPEMRIRFTSPHPKDFPDQVLEVIQDRHNICKQIHLPAQSGNTRVLESMRRGYTREAYLDLVDHIRTFLPDVALTSDFICGFCGETEEAHRDTLSLVEAVQYDMAYVFSYSLREKTHAHRRLEDDVPLELKKRRVAEVLDMFRRSAKQLHDRQVGSHHLVLVEGASRRSPTDLAGRNDNNTKVIFPQSSVPDSLGSTVRREIQPGDYVVVEVHDSTSQVLKGTPIHISSLQEHSQKKERLKITQS